MRSAIVDAHVADLFRSPVGVVRQSRVRECWINVRRGFYGTQRHDYFHSHTGAVWAATAATFSQSPVLYRIHVIPKGERHDRS